MEVTLTNAVYILILGMIIVFIVLFLLMGIIALTRIISGKSSGTETKAAPAPVAAAPAKPAALAPGSCGEVTVFEVPDRTAAMVMALVADQLDTPLNELRFISIREVKE